MEKNPTRDLKRLIPPPPRNRPISDFEIKLLLEHLEFTDQPPAMRQSEITTLD